MNDLNSESSPVATRLQTSMEIPSLNSLLANVTGSFLPPASASPHPTYTLSHTISTTSLFPSSSGRMIRTRESVTEEISPSVAVAAFPAAAAAAANAHTPTEEEMETVPLRPRSRRAAARAARVAISHRSTPCGRPVAGSNKKRSSTAAAAAAASPVEEDPSPPRKRPRRSCTKKPPPNAKDDAKYESASDSEDVEGKGERNHEKSSCCICMSEPKQKDLSAVNACEHRFCFDCISKWADRENTCPLCKVRFSKITRVHKAKKRRGEKSQANSKSVRTRDQRSDLVSGAALEAMLNSIAASNRASIGIRSDSAGGPRLGSFLFARLGATSTRRAGGVNYRIPNPHLPTPRNRGHFEDLADSDGEDSSDSGFNSSQIHADFNELMRQTMSMSRGDSRRSAPFASSSAAAAVPPNPFLSTLSLFPRTIHHSSRHGPSAATRASAIPAVSLPRSYASNIEDRNAGSNRENPLEIDDESDDDSVEVVSAPAGSTSLWRC